MKITQLFLIFIFFGILTCNAGNKKLLEKPETIIHPKQTSEKQDDNMPGEKVYQATCLACHMADGSGVPGMTPPINNSKMISGVPSELIKIVLEGKEGEVEVNGEVFDGYMPPQPTLSNQEVADVLTYVRSKFGKDAGPVSPEEVQKLRK